MQVQLQLHIIYEIFVRNLCSYRKKRYPRTNTNKFSLDRLSWLLLNIRVPIQIEHRLGHFLTYYEHFLDLRTFLETKLTVMYIPQS